MRFLFIHRIAALTNTNARMKLKAWIHFLVVDSSINGFCLKILRSIFRVLETNVVISGRINPRGRGGIQSGTMYRNF